MIEYQPPEQPSMLNDGDHHSAIEPSPLSLSSETTLRRENRLEQVDQWVERYIQDHPQAYTGC